MNWIEESNMNKNMNIYMDLGCICICMYKRVFSTAGDGGGGDDGGNSNLSICRFVDFSIWMIRGSKAWIKGLG